MKIVPVKIPGVFQLNPAVTADPRGRFVKIFEKKLFESFGLTMDLHEEFYTVSGQRVLRGLHFQIPPHEHVKIVHCIAGHVMDVVLDLRLGSPTYGQFEAFELTADKPSSIYIPPGLAHGFYVKSGQATLLYQVSAAYSPAHDTGILWSSTGISWPDLEPIVSDRDSRFMPLADFKSPFKYVENIS